MTTARRTIGATVLAVVLLAPWYTRTQEAPANPLAARIDPYVEKQRVVVMTPGDSLSAPTAAIPSPG